MKNLLLHPSVLRDLDWFCRSSIFRGEKMGDGVVEISREGPFSLDQAQRILPVIRRITQEYAQKVETLMARLESIPINNNELIYELESQINELIKGWHEKLRKLGGIPKGLWLVDFDCGDGYYCWKYPEGEILYWHSYTDGFSGRKLLTETAPSLDI